MTINKTAVSIEKEELQLFYIYLYWQHDNLPNRSQYNNLLHSKRQANGYQKNENYSYFIYTCTGTMTICQTSVSITTHSIWPSLLMVSVIILTVTRTDWQSNFWLRFYTLKLTKSLKLQKTQPSFGLLNRKCKYSIEASFMHISK